MALGEWQNDLSLDQAGVVAVVMGFVRRSCAATGRSNAHLRALRARMNSKRRREVMDERGAWKAKMRGGKKDYTHGPSHRLLYL